RVLVINVSHYTAFLGDTHKLNEFKIPLNIRFQALQDLLKEEESTMEDNWKDIVEALTSTCQEILGLKYMERSNNVGNREDQSNSNGNEEIQLSSTGNQRNPLDLSWTEKASYGEVLLYSGHEKDNAPHTQGVALMLSKVARNALVGWESHGSRIIKASFKTKKEGIKMNIIQCYAHTNDSNDDIKDQFYERLQSVIEKCSRKDLTILKGDLNAKVGIDNTGYEDIMGRHGLGERNENGERFANLCAFNKLVIGGTIFPHKRIHKATWISPDHTTANQIDHIWKM
ncbi:unnamed protein product, partial [Schistosoma margrebowiei]